jgi:hypothetical protein
VWRLIGGNGGIDWFLVKFNKFLNRVNGLSSVIYLGSLYFSHLLLRGNSYSD